MEEKQIDKIYELIDASKYDEAEIEIKKILDEDSKDTEQEVFLKMLSSIDKMMLCVGIILVVAMIIWKNMWKQNLLIKKF